jgi:hypothetical protein
MFHVKQVNGRPSGLVTFYIETLLQWVTEGNIKEGIRSDRKTRKKT